MLWPAVCELFTPFEEEIRLMKPSYTTWNDTIGRYFFRPQYAGQRVFLTVDDDTLWKISQGHGSPVQFAHPHLAVQAFVAAVRDELRRCGEWTFKPPRAGEYPRFLGWLLLDCKVVDVPLSSNAIVVTLLSWNTLFFNGLQNGLRFADAVGVEAPGIQ